MSTNSRQPEMTLYRDQGSSGAVRYGSAFLFGAPGLVISSLAIAKAQAREMKSWKAALGPQEDNFLHILNERLHAELE